MTEITDAEVEAVARAISTAERFDPNGTNAGEPMWHGFRREARVAITIHRAIEALKPMGASMFEAAYGPDRSKWPPNEPPLAKRPVAFRIDLGGGKCLLFNDEATAAAKAETIGAAYQGLYVRDGT